MGPPFNGEAAKSPTTNTLQHEQSKSQGVRRGRAHATRQPARNVRCWHLADKRTQPSNGRYWGHSGQSWSLVCVGYDAIVESPGGISPPGAPRSVREPLDSHGSRCSAVGTRGQQLYLVHGLLLLPVGFSWRVASLLKCRT